MLRRLLTFPGVVALLLFPATSAVSSTPQVSALLEQIDSASLDPERAVSVGKLEIDLGAAELHIRRGTLFPATEVGGQVVELVLLGQATLHLEAPDEVEAGQLELFTGDGSLAEPITEAVMVICRDEAILKLLDRDAAGSLDPGLVERAEALFGGWTAGSARKLLNVRSGILLDAMGDPVYGSYFVGLFRSEELGEFLLVVEPDEEEQVTLGQFVPLEVSEKQKRKERKRIHRQQRKGKLIGLEVEDLLGQWDTWLSSRLRDFQGSFYPGAAAFEPEHYKLDVSIGERGRTIRGTARIRVVAAIGGRRVVALSMHPDLRVLAVRDEGGQELDFQAENGEAYVFLDLAPEDSEQLELEVDFEGVLLNKLKSKLYELRDTVFWHPHVGTLDRATYDVTLRWPKKFDVVASGRVVNSGLEEKMRWARRTLDVAALGFSFELGDFERRGTRAGHVVVTVAFDREVSNVPLEIQEEIVEVVKDSLLYYEQVFGPYPLDYLTVVTSPREFAQGLLGFVSLPSLLAEDLGVFADLLGIEDRRSVIAHEIAHQWWGNLVGWRSYRDQWISEAMANYAAMAWARNRLDKRERPSVGPTYRWQAVLTSYTEAGRPLESHGPLVLGGRLNSSISAEAYQAIVYKKGAVVLDMLAQAFGEENFLQILNRLVKVASYKSISTEDFLLVLEKASGADLQWFGEQYIYGTGLPEVYYSFDFEPREDGKWLIKVVARQHRPYRYHYRAVVTDGGFDLGREAVDLLEAEDPSLIVPVQVAMYDPSVPSTEGSRSKKKRSREEPRKDANRTLRGRMVLRTEHYEFEFEVAHEPLDLWMDRDRQVYARFFSEDRAPKRMLMYQGLDNVAASRHEDAERLFRSALAAEVSRDEAEGMWESWVQQAEGEALDVRLHLQLAWLYMDQGRLEDAEQEVAVARKVAGSHARYDERLKIAESRLDILRGDYERAYKRLKKGLRHGQRMTSTAGYTLLAIAAHVAGDNEVYERAASVAKRRGADLCSLMEQDSAIAGR